MRRVRKRNRRRNRGGRICISCMVIALTLILSLQIIRLYDKNESYRIRQAELEAELEAENEYAQALEEQEKYVGSDEYVEDMARGKLGMVHKGEIVFREK